MHKITLAFSHVLLYIVLRADAVRHFPADAMRHQRTVTVKNPASSNGDPSYSAPGSGVFDSRGSRQYAKPIADWL